MKPLLANSKNALSYIVFVFAFFIMSAAVAQNQPLSNTFKLYSFNSKIPLGSVSVNRISDISYLGEEGQWVNVRVKGGIPAWLKSQDVALLSNNNVRISSEKARIYIEAKEGSRYLMTLSRGFTSPVLSVKGSWYQVSTPSYLTVKMLGSEYSLLTNKQIASSPIVPNNNVATEQTSTSNLNESSTVISTPPQSIPNTANKPVQQEQVIRQTQNVVSNGLKPSRSAYFLTPGDIVSISVFGEPDMVLSNQRIGENGYVSFPLIGQVVIKGKTTQQVEDMIESMLSKGYLRDPKVNVVINAYRPLYVRGAVNTPGSYDFTEGLTVAKVLTLAGGVEKGAQTDTLKLYRNDELFLQNLTIDSQTLIQPGDILTVEEGVGAVEKASSFIYLHGEVNSPGGYEYRQGLTVEKAVALAGGFSPRASRKKIDITRETADQEEPEKIKRVKLFYDLKPGDVIHIGASWF